LRLAGDEELPLDVGTFLAPSHKRADIPLARLEVREVRATVQFPKSFFPDEVDILFAEVKSARTPATVSIFVFFVHDDISSLLLERTF
jgi:hypothetical protein